MSWGWGTSGKSQSPKVQGPGALMSKGRKKMNVPVQEETENLPCLHLLFYLVLNRLDDSHPPWWEWIFFTHSIDSNTNLFWKHSLTGMPRTKILPVLWASLSLGKLTYTLKHCRLQRVERPGMVAIMGWHFYGRVEAIWKWVETVSFSHCRAAGGCPWPSQQGSAGPGFQSR